MALPPHEGDDAHIAPPVMGGICLCEKPYQIIKKRADFLKASSARRCSAAGFFLQARNRHEGDAVRVGFTCSKKMGNAVVRNRAKRRMRALVQMIMPAHGQKGWDYVLVGRPHVTDIRNFVDLQHDLVKALRHIHGDRGEK